MTICPQCLTFDFVREYRGEDYVHLYCETCEYEELHVDRKEEPSL